MSRAPRLTTLEAVREIRIALVGCAVMGWAGWIVYQWLRWLSMH